MFHGDEVFIAAVSKLRKVFNINQKKNGPTEKRATKPRQSRGHAVYVEKRRCGGVLITPKYIITPCRFTHACVCSHAGGYYSWHPYTHVKIAGISHAHARTNTAKLHPSHLNCRARSPSRSTGAQSLTTDIILIAHHGRVVCPHSHPDSLCAENPTTENSGLRVSGGLRTAVSVLCVSPKSILISSLRLPGYIPREHGNSRAQTQTGMCMCVCFGLEARG